VEVLHQVEHRLDHPRRGEDLPMVGDALFGTVLTAAAINCTRQVEAAAAGVDANKGTTRALGGCCSSSQRS
jgi:hypothetical protein